MIRHSLCRAVLVCLIGLNCAYAAERGFRCPHRVAVFAGHTESVRWHGNTPGPKSCTGVYEFRFNDEVTKLFEHESNDQIEYITVPSTLNIPRQSRPELAALMKASLFVEIHHDSVQRDLFDKLRSARSGDRILDYYRGFCLLVFDDEKSMALAKAIEASMIDAGLQHSPYRHEDVRLHNRMTLIPGTRVTYRREKLFVLRTSVMPAVIVECGVTANPREELILQKRDYRERIVHAIHEGISNYLRSDR